MKFLLESEPQAASIPDSNGRLPLHVAVDKNEPWIRPIQVLCKAYPQACGCRDGKYLYLDT